MTGEQPAGARPLSPDELGGTSGPLDPRDFIDPRGWTSEFGRPGESSRNTGRQQILPPVEIPKVPTLEEILEGEGVSAAPTPAPVPAPQTALPQKSRLLRNLLIGFVVFVVLGAATVLVLHTLGLLRGDTTSENQDIIRPE